MTYLSVLTPTIPVRVLVMPEHRACFAVEEIAWLREEAVSISRRKDARNIRDVHHFDSGFARLAAHPRILDLVEDALGSRALLVDSALHFADAPELASVPRDCLRVIVDLGPSPDAVAPRSGFRGLGDVWVHEPAGESFLPDDKLIFAMDFRRGAGIGQSRQAATDDALWPQAAVCAG